MPTTCRVLIVDRGGRLSRLAQPLFTGRLIEVSPSADYAEIINAVVAHQPHLALVDLEGNPGAAVAAVESLMAHQPIPVLLLSGGDAKKDAIRGLAAGALDVLVRPARWTPEFFEVLKAQVLLLAKVKVVRHMRGSRTRPKPRPPFPLVAIAASLGGPRALAQLLKGLPESFVAPIVICQHITAGFADDLSRWLRAETGREVLEAVEEVDLEPGRIFVAGSDAHLVVQSDFSLAIEKSAPVGGFRPSCDVLLRSVAATFGEAAIGVVLTGMGRDGARGLKEIRAHGGHTVAQDEATSVVFGMPGEAIALGAAEKVLPLDQIAAQLARWV